MGSAPSRTSQSFQLSSTAQHRLWVDTLCMAKPEAPSGPHVLGGAGQLAAPPSASLLLLLTHPCYIHPQEPGHYLRPCQSGLTFVRGQAWPGDAARGGAPGKGSRPSP